jgi:hypothetical protein
MKNTISWFAIMLACAMAAGCSHRASDASIGPDGKLKHFAPRPNPANLTGIIQDDINKNRSRIAAMRAAANAQHGGGEVVLPPTQ